MTSAPSLTVDPASVATWLPTAQALLFFLARQDNYRKPLFSKEEIFVGPDTDTHITPTRTFAVKAPLGSYDVAEILHFLSPEQKPDFIVVKADATRRNFPRNLGQLACPKILLVGDTHHLANPLQTLIAYAKSEPFDFIIFDHTRHHAHWFAQAGLKNLRWLPALDYGFVPRELKPTPSRPLTFVGQVGHHHPYRRAVLDQIKSAGLPLELLRGKLQETADIYADSQITLNVSLNGDLNLRVFEALSAGGFLLTDELSPESGLPLLFEPGKHLETWRTPGELIEKIRHYLAHPAEAQRIRAAGQAELVRTHHPEVKLREFHDLVFNDRVNPRYDLTLDTRVSVGFSAIAEATSDLPAYETVQELHRHSSRVILYAPESSRDRLGRFTDLPRLEVLSHTTLAPQPTDTATAQIESVLWLNEETLQPADLLARFTGSLLFATGSATVILPTWGFVPVAGTPALYRRTQSDLFLAQAMQAGAHDTVQVLLPTLFAQATTAADCLTVAEFASRIGSDDLYRTAVQRAISFDRLCVPALLQLASLTLEAGDETGTCLILEEVARIVTLPPEIEDLRRQLVEKTAANETLSSYAIITHRTPTPATETAHRILIVTNLFPPQELGGYGRMIWEFAAGLRARGHSVRVLTGHAGYLEKNATPDETEMETHVSRVLDLTGTWRHGRTQAEPDPKKVAARSRSNAQKALAAARKFGADLILVGNLDFLGVPLVHELLAAGYPVLHALANAGPGYEPAEQPDSPQYWVAPCSEWNGRAFTNGGYRAARIATLYPGARLDRFYRPFLPNTSRLRIAYASLVMPYKGAHVLVQALGQLHRHGVDFMAEIAGDTTDPKFVEQLKSACTDAGMTHKVSFPGFLDRLQLDALFARSNVLVFPSQFAEPFGISQVEAMAAGLVVVSSGTGGACEIVRDQIDGLLFPADDAGALAERLHSLAAQPELFARLQQGGQLRALAFSVDSAVARIESLLAEMLATGLQVDGISGSTHSPALVSTSLASATGL